MRWRSFAKPKSPMVNLNQDFREFIGLLESEEVSYLILGRFRFSQESMECHLPNVTIVGLKWRIMD